MKKYIRKITYFIILFLISFVCLSGNILALENVTEGFNICEKSGVVKSFQIVGYCLFVVKIVVPIILIIMGTIDLGKAFISSDDKAIKTSINILVKRAIAGVVIFFIPTIVSFGVSLVDNANALNDFNCLSECLASPSECEIPNGGVFGVDAE